MIRTISIITKKIKIVWKQAPNLKPSGPVKGPFTRHRSMVFFLTCQINLITEYARQSGNGKKVLKFSLEGLIQDHPVNSF